MSANWPLALKHLMGPGQGVVKQMIIGKGVAHVLRWNLADQLPCHTSVISVRVETQSPPPGNSRRLSPRPGLDSSSTGQRSALRLGLNRCPGPQNQRAGRRSGGAKPVDLSCRLEDPGLIALGCIQPQCPE